MARFRLKRQPQVLAPAGFIGVSGDLQYARSKSIGSVLLGLGGRTQIGGGIGFTVSDPPIDAWVVPDPQFQAVSGQTFDLKTTLPAEAIAGGTFDVDASGSALPSGMTLSADGILSVGTATAPNTTNVVYGYNEPVSGGTEASVLTLFSTTSSSSAPYSASFFPLEGTVPSGQTLTSTDDASMRCSVIARWPDNSARIAVLSGVLQIDANAPKQLHLQVSQATSATALTAARVGQLITNITVNLNELGSYSLTSFGTPAKTWWANDRVICARYYLPLTTGMVAAIDVHAYSTNHALVEVQVENSLVNPASPVRPSTKTFTNASVSVNGTTIVSGVSSPVSGVTPAGGDGWGGYNNWGHSGLQGWRGFFASTRVGGWPNIEVTHTKAYLESHPLFVKSWRPQTESLLATYANDAYSVWNCGRLNVMGNGATGGRAGIGLFPAWEMDYLRSGDRRAQRAVLASARGAIHVAFQMRDATTYTPLTYTQIAGKNRDANTFPSIAGASNYQANIDPAYEVAHHPNVGPLAFLCHPSPMFIEMAQKNATWLMTLLGDNTMSFWAQIRGKAWGWRSIGRGIWMSPDTDSTWKSAAVTNFVKNMNEQMLPYMNPPSSVSQPLGLVWFPGTDNWTFPGGAYTAYPAGDVNGGLDGMQQYLWQNWWIILACHTLEGAKVLGDPTVVGSSAKSFRDFTDWICNLPVRIINETTTGAWRYQSVYENCVGRAAHPYNGNLGSGQSEHPNFDAPATWGEMYAWYYNQGTQKPTVGYFYGGDSRNNDLNTASSSGPGSDRYATQFVAAVACAAERNARLTGADAAWNKMLSGVSDIQTFMDGSSGYNDASIWGVYPRNK